DDIGKVPEQLHGIAVAVPPIDRVSPGAVRCWTGEDQKAAVERREVAHTLTIAEPQLVKASTWRATAEQCVERHRQDRRAPVVQRRSTEANEHPPAANRDPLNGHPVIFQSLLRKTLKLGLRGNDISEIG